MFWIKWITSCSSDLVTPLFLAEVTCKFFGFCGVEMVSFFGVNWKCWWWCWYCLDGSFLNVSRWNGLVTNFLSFHFYYLGGKLFYLILLFLILRVVFSCIFPFMDGVVWLLRSDCLLVLVSSCCAIDAWFLSAKLLMPNIHWSSLLLLFLCKSFSLLTLPTAEAYDFSFNHFELNVSVGTSSFLTRSYSRDCLDWNFNWWNFFCFCCLCGRSWIFWFIFIVPFIS